jgi:hypothetical protein
MPLEEFHGETFVAFVDISGFKALMKDTEKAYKALNSFYQIGYNSLKSDSNRNPSMELRNRCLTHTLRFAPVRLDDEPVAHLAPVRQEDRNRWACSIP